jgi:hypothetical protein
MFSDMTNVSLFTLTHGARVGKILTEGLSLGTGVGPEDGDGEGAPVGGGVGEILTEGLSLGTGVGPEDGDGEGAPVGGGVGGSDGVADGAGVGT